jgi:hypothetical protein
VCQDKLAAANSHLWSAKIPSVASSSRRYSRDCGVVSGGFTEDVCGRETYVYDSNTLDTSFAPAQQEELPSVWVFAETAVDRMRMRKPPDSIRLNKFQLARGISLKQKRLKTDDFVGAPESVLGAGVGRSNRPGRRIKSR